MAHLSPSSSSADGAPAGEGSLRIVGARLAEDPGRGEVDIVIGGGRIRAVTSRGPGGPGGDAAGPVLDAGGRLALPGLVDIHVHGAGGADVLDGTTEALRTISRALARTGTTAFVAATAPRDDGGGHGHLRAAARLAGRPLDGATLLGVHLEGPFIDPGTRGGLPAGAVDEPSPGALDALLEAADGALRIMTVAPEVPGVLPLVEELGRLGVVPSLGHSSAGLEEVEAGFDAGIRHVTHLFNAMAGFHHRAPGPLPAIHGREDVTAEIIADGVHVDPRAVAWAYRLLGRERLACVSDGVRAVGLPDGRYRYGGRPFEARDGAARYPDGTLIGTAVGMAEILRRFRSFTGCGLRAAVDACSRIPARIVGLGDRKGSLGAGMDGDVVLLDEGADVSGEEDRGGGEPWAVVVGGRIVFRRDGSDPVGRAGPSA